MDLPVCTTLLGLILCGTSVCASGAATSTSDSANTRNGSTGAETASASQDCSKPPWCIHSTWGVLGVEVLVVIGVTLALVLLLIVCASAVLLVRCCRSCCYGESELELDTPLTYPAYPRQATGYQYHPVQQHEFNIEAKSHSDNTDSGNSGRMRMWFGALALFCCGVLVAALGVGGGAILWWQASGSPPMAGFARAANESHNTTQQQNDKGSHVEKDS